LRGLVVLDKDAIGDCLGDHLGPDTGDLEDMDPVWLRTMWEDGRSACDDMIEILISLALLKLKFKL
jgi:hypothetical protein